MHTYSPGLKFTLDSKHNTIRLIKNKESVIGQKKRILICIDQEKGGIRNVLMFYLDIA